MVPGVWCVGMGFFKYFSVCVWISCKPFSLEMGCAEGFTSFIPLYWLGLWLAVNMTPAVWWYPDAKYSSSVELRFIIVALAPRWVAPKANCCANFGDDARMSCPIRMFFPASCRVST